jgi:catalase
MVTPEESVQAAHERFGVHPGARALHAKGTLCKGTFTATPEAASLSRAAHLSGDPVELTARLSNGGGDPDEPDYAPDVRGLALKIYLPDGSRTDIVAQTAPRFPSRDADGFVELLGASEVGPAMAWKLPLFLAKNPAALLGLPKNISALKPPASYATLRYYAIHAFKWLDADGGERYVRYTLVPEAGQATISPREARRRGRDYLKRDLVERLERGPIRFGLELQIAGEGDDVDDPRSVWPSERRRVTAGTVEITALDTERETEGDILVFDPTRVVDGIELSDDPVLRFRSRAYSASVKQRSGADRPAKLA